MESLAVLRGRRTQRDRRHAIAALKALERANPDAPIQSALFSELGHKGDLILVHFRDSLEALNQVELDLAQTELYDFLTPTHSYVSVVELGLYESSRKTYEGRRQIRAAHPGMERRDRRLARARIGRHGSASLPRRA